MDISPTTHKPLTLPADSARGTVRAVSGRKSPPAGNSLPSTVELSSVEKAVQQIQAYLGASQRQLDFSFDKASGQTVIKVINPNSGEVVRQIPAEDVLKMAAALNRNGFHTLDETA